MKVNETYAQKKTVRFRLTVYHEKTKELLPVADAESYCVRNLVQALFPHVVECVAAV